MAQVLERLEQPVSGWLPGTTQIDVSTGLMIQAHKQDDPLDGIDLIFDQVDDADKALKMAATFINECSLDGTYEVEELARRLSTNYVRRIRPVPALSDVDRALDMSGSHW